jgi:hypothetical protein
MEFFSNLSREVAVVVRPREGERERSKLKVGVSLGCRGDKLNRLAKKRGLMQMKWAGWKLPFPPANGNAPHLKQRFTNQLVLSEFKQGNRPPATL